MQTNMVHHGNQVALTYEIPMAEVVLDFSTARIPSRGGTSLHYNFKRFQASHGACGCADQRQRVMRGADHPPPRTAEPWS
ncbi:hypothetical protein ACNKHO_16340 [Shigella flexneri]